jgi:2-oxoglutarate dehydrogenase E2 component (dihydrolipoamide succinyltransferase)
MTKLYLTMPQPGETITEGMIVSWIAKEGDDLSEGKPLAELETEKAVFEYESPFEGRILKILYPAETRVKVGEPIAVMEVPQVKAEHYMMLGIGRLVEGEGASPDSVSIAQIGVIKSAAPSASALAGVAVNYEDVRLLTDIKMSPYVRRVALQAGVAKETLLSLAQNHPEARVTKEAILLATGGKVSVATVETPQQRRNVAGRKPAPIVPHDPGTDYRVMPFSPVRMRIAENMSLSKQHIPHAHTGLTVDVTRAVQFRNQYKEAFKKKHGVNLNYLSLFFSAIAKAVKKYPSVNASFVENGDKNEIRVFNRINLGVAVGSEYGLIIPVLKGIEDYSFQKFNQDLNDKIERGMKKKLMPEDYSGPTLIFNNFGFFGTTIGVQIIQYPLAATLGMGVIEKRVVPHFDGIAVRDVADFFLAFDHRIFDGREAGLFLSELKKEIENLPLDASMIG